MTSLCFHGHALQRQNGFSKEMIDVSSVPLQRLQRKQAESIHNPHRDVYGHNGTYKSGAAYIASILRIITTKARSSPTSSDRVMRVDGLWIATSKRPSMVDPMWMKAMMIFDLGRMPIWKRWGRAKQRTWYVSWSPM